jgi:ABC-type Fe3+-hydroxamate transport system substrate-binding protein
MRVRWPILTLLLLFALLAGCGSSTSSSSSSTSSSASSSASTTSGTQLGFEGIPIEPGADVASPSSTGTTPVDGIQCGATEQLAYHIHAHLAVFVNGSSRALPGGVGIPGSQVVQSSQGPVANGGQCIYWLHTHAPDGVIHIESPTQRIYTLGNFFDIWRQPLSATRVGGVRGKITAIVNGKQWTKDLRSIPLDPHAVIQLNVGTPTVPFKTVNWSGTNL